jgi:ribosomal protein L7/L12
MYKNCFSFFSKKNLKGFRYFSSQNEKRFREILTKYHSVKDKLSKENEEKTYLEYKEKLSPERREYVEMLADKFADLNQYQILYYKTALKDHLMKKKQYSLMELNTDWSKLAKVEKKVDNFEDAYFSQQEYMAKFVEWLGKQPKADLGLGLGAAQSPVVEKQEKKEEVKKEEKKEKSIYDIELTSFDAAKKIALIKEVRAYTNLGLKEAKELVEKAPTIIMKSIKKDDTEAIVKKLTDNGAQITLK